jgi:hypothetical protein
LDHPLAERLAPSPACHLWCMTAMLASSMDPDDFAAESIAVGLPDLWIGQGCPRSFYCPALLLARNPLQQGTPLAAANVERPPVPFLTGTKTGTPAPVPHGGRSRLDPRRVCPAAMLTVLYHVEPHGLTPGRGEA